jgi:hypothetical protein
MSKVTLALLLAASLGATLAAADDSAQRVEVHGLGGWAYGNSDGNHYLGGTDEGEYNNANMALNVSAHPEERLAIVGQVEWRIEGEAEAEVELDFVFAEWRFSDAAHVRVGKVKQPFGLSTEVFDVGTLRPFYALPQAVYGPVGFVAEGYVGVGLTGRFETRRRWELDYDAYVGGQIVEEYEAPEAVLFGVPLAGQGFHSETTRDMFGGRLTLTTPFGLRLGGSGYSGKTHDRQRRSGFGGHAEYALGVWSLRAEAAREESPEHRKRAAYVEAARRFGPHWQVALQYGHLRSELLDLPVPAEPGLLEHDEIALGLNYWVRPGFVLKASVHHVDGNRLAGPEVDELFQEFVEGELRRKTKLFLVAAQFTF